MRLPVACLPALLSLLLLTPLPAEARECADDPRRGRPTLTLRIDNDLFGGGDQDQNYSHGMLLSVVSPNVLSYGDDPCLPPLAHFVNRHLGWLQPDGAEQFNMVASIGQALFTPEDYTARELLTDDRPYAAALLFSLGYNARRENALQATRLNFGIVGPSALGEQIQDSWHKIIDAELFNGWDHQLHDEPVVQLVHERMQRYDPGYLWPRTGLRHDFITHWGGALGNLASFINAGAEWRIGWRLPDDFGSSPLRPVGENASPTRTGAGSFSEGWSGHVYLAFDTRVMFNDITLDGNTFRDSHSVDKRHFVADFGYGFAITRGDWKVTIARYQRTREFAGQRERPDYGSVSISKRF